ncbi:MULTISPECIES: redox-sensing transcriptional repressor Rex [Peptoniphilus]|uniref:redox-sensing transcriptional repressor Rex n=1 Tax=Peptoniphilus TaxID=162289 RepID=UPI0001DA9EDC|nr:MULTISPECIES: redox-sensing transcriptional repressor Rex [Peptoniphilus]EFI41522.1 putative redox-sensing transcriptional repressor Rex [Peptoniphilus sp. oral taxon 386 str. F0131]
MANRVNRVSETVIRRLPIYHRYLTEILDKKIERISSSELSNLTGFTASQIRQDLNNFGGFGQQGYGYNVSDLRDEIGNILGMDHIYKTIVIGAGRLGSAIARYSGFRKSGFKIQALFDSDKDIVGNDIDSIPILDADDLEEYVRTNKIDVAIITVPKDHAVEVINDLISYKIKGIWNFAPIDISVPDDVVIENVRLNDSLLKLSYYLKENSLK